MTSKKIHKKTPHTTKKRTKRKIHPHTHYTILGFAILFAVILGSVWNHTAAYWIGEPEHTEDLAAYPLITPTGPPQKYSVSSTTPQFVLLSFDGSKSIEMLNETLDFERSMIARGKPLHFTYFINAAYFLTEQSAPVYQGPRHARGISNIGFSSTADDIAKRVAAFNQALLEGNEIASHATGHFNGNTWSQEEWKSEFDSFNTIIAHAQDNNPSVEIPVPNFGSSTIVGFRAPELGVNEHLFRTLKDFNYLYDASDVGLSYHWPRKDMHGIWHIPLGTISIGEEAAPAIAMDYSLWMHQSRAENTAVRGSEEWNKKYKDVLGAYMNYFNGNYNNSRAPVVIGHHFSKWNDGLYWEAMKTFAENVCGQPHVKCVTFKSFTHYLNKVGVPDELTSEVPILK